MVVGVRIYLCDTLLDEPYEFLYNLREKLERYPIEVSTKVLYDNDEEDCSLLKIECERIGDEDKDEDLVIERDVFTTNSSEDVFDYILEALHIKKDEKICDSDEERGEEYDGWYGDD